MPVVDANYARVARNCAGCTCVAIRAYVFDQVDKGHMLAWHAHMRTKFLSQKWDFGTGLARLRVDGAARGEGALPGALRQRGRPCEHNKHDDQARLNARSAHCVRAPRRGASLPAA